MAISKRVLITSLSAVYLTALTILAGYALHKTISHHLPIPGPLSAFALALPPIAGLAVQMLSTATDSTSRLQLSKHTPRLLSRQTVSQTLITLLFIYEAVVAALAGTYISPSSGLACGLETRWRGLYQAKNGGAIAAIQDAFRCCGLRSPLDMAYPFPARGRGADACVLLHERSGSCFEDWRAEERGVAGVLMAVAVAVAAWKMLMLWAMGRDGGSWFEEAGAVGAGRRSLEFPPAARGREGDYRDLEEDAEEASGLVATRVQPSRLRDDAQMWAGE